METMEKTMQELKFKKLTFEDLEKLQLESIERYPTFLMMPTPHLDGMQDEIFKAVHTRFFLRDVAGPHPTSGEDFTLKVAMRIIDKRVALKDVKIRIIPNEEYVDRSPEVPWTGFAVFNTFDYNDGWIYADLGLKVKPLAQDGYYDIADIYFKAGVDCSKLFQFKKTLDNVKVFLQA